MTHAPADLDALLVAGGVRLKVDGQVATVTLDRPGKLNAMTPSTWVALAAIGDALPEPVRVVVVRGEGRSFCAGLDLQIASPEGLPGERSLPELASLDDAAMADQIGAWQEGFVWLGRPEFISVAAVQGHAIGGGFQLALACDLRVLAEDATFSMREPALGIVPDLAGTKPLVDCVGYARALEICATTRRVPADEAERIGLANRVVPRDQLDAAVDELVTALLAHPRGAVTGAKALLREASRRSLDEQRLAERTTQLPLLRQLFGA
jgi:enoyl-CoA hydratase/carnithine racemase